MNVGTSGYVPIGGTSASTPLLAGMTADANTYSLAHGGTRIGFASPFFYAHPEFIHDITSGHEQPEARRHAVSGHRRV